MEQLVLSKMDKDFKYEIAAEPGSSFFKRCFSCGTCTASCPVSEIDEEFNPRLIIRQALLGMRKELLSSKTLWFCTQCYTCYARCPQDVRFTDVMATLRKMAVKEGFAPHDMKEKAEKIGLLSQKMRHALVDYAWAASKSEELPETLKTVQKQLKDGMKELG